MNCVELGYDGAGWRVRSDCQSLKRNDGSVLSLNQTNSLDNAGRISQWDVRCGQASAGAAVTYGKFGSIEKEVFNNKIVRTYEYDCHGWLSQVKTALPKFGVLPQASTADLSAQFYSKATEAQVEPMASVKVSRVYTESILYAGGNSPRYDGTASAHVSTLGGRYDYSFDCHDRLVKADYSGSGDADFSAEYAYNSLAAPVKIKRQGVIDYRSIILIGSSAEIYGTLDDLSYQWDGARLEAVTAQANGADFYGRTGFALSAQGGTADFEWNGAGLMTADSSRGITNILYNRYGQPTRVDFTDGSRVNYTYSCSGGLLKVTSYGKPTVTRPIPLAPITAQRYYCGNFVFDADSLSYVNFPGGYFDSNGSPFYRHTDWQGSVTMVTNSSGQIEQHTGYYPYGEPWAEPDGQPYLFSGKERMRDNALNEYDFSARRYIPALALWTTPDPLAGKFQNLNPFGYCCGNPIKFVDRDGCDAKIEIKGSVVSIYVNVILEGEHVTDKLIEIFKNNIMNSWGAVKSYEYNHTEYSIEWNVNVRKAEDGEVRDYNGVNNYLTIRNGKKSEVTDTNSGYIRSEGRNGMSIEEDCPMGHEFGHMLGLRDKYVGNLPSPKWAKNIMALSTNVESEVESKNFDKFLKPLLWEHIKTFSVKISNIFPEIGAKYGWDTTVHMINKNNREKE